MLDKAVRGAILTLHEQGHSQRVIAKDLHISRSSVQEVLREGQAAPGRIEKPSQLDAHVSDIVRWHQECQGNRVLVMDKLKEKDCSVSYSSLTWFCRRHGIGVKPKIPARRIVTDPGEEMQHDTSPYTLELGGKRVKRHGATLVLGYSRMIYLQFYPTFDRFRVKIFLTHAFRFFGGVCRQCVIDNSSVVIACGAGPHAQVAPEMEAFEKRFGFEFYAHALGHADRSGKVERPYAYIEGNFLAGRRFKDDADLNAQALEWVTQKANPRILREFKMSPQGRFEVEKPHLVPLPLYIPEPYRIHQRTVDSYSCITLHTVQYPIPPAYLGKTLLVRETEHDLIVMDGSQEVVTHRKRPPGSPPPPGPPLSSSRQRHQARIVEEDKIKERGEPLTHFLEQLKAHRGTRYRGAIRKLYRLVCQYHPEAVHTAIERALQYRLFDIDRVETILLQHLAERDYQLPLGFDDA